MALVGGYDNEIFISYSHIDNEPFGDPRGGWVDIFHEQLQNFVNVHVGQRTKVWRDKRLTGGEVFSAEIEDQLRRSAILVTVISPGYLRSEWCNRELLGFTKTAETLGNLRVGNLQRVVKVLRLPVERSALPPQLSEVLGGQFYREDPASGRARDLLLDPSADARQVFLARVDDVAQDLSRLLDAMADTAGATTHLRSSSAAAKDATSTGGTVFLAWTTSDLAEEREKLRRELEVRNYIVLPTGAPPLDATGVRERIITSLRDANVAVFLIGAHYGFVPEGEERSIIELQSDEAIYQESTSTAARIVWFAPNVQPHPRLSAVVERLQQPPARGGMDVLANQTIEGLKTVVLDRLNMSSKPAALAESTSHPVVYLLSDQLDRDTVAPIQDYLFDQSVEVRLPLFDGHSEEIRTEHYATLKECQGVLLFWDKASESWLRNALRDLNKVFGLGRTEPYKTAALYLAGLPDPVKERFRTHQVAVLRPDRELDVVILRRFVDQLVGG